MDEHTKQPQQQQQEEKKTEWEFENISSFITERAGWANTARISLVLSSHRRRGPTERDHLIIFFFFARR